MCYKYTYSLRWPSYVFNLVVNTKLPATLFHRRSTTVSLPAARFIWSHRQKNLLITSMMIFPIVNNNNNNNNNNNIQYL